MSKTTIDIDPKIVMFTHSRIRPFFTGCGRRIEDTLLDITENRITVEDLPLITVIENEGNYFSLNNRRLYVLKQLRSRGLLPHNKVKVYIKNALEREKRKYTPENCSMEAKIMIEHNSKNSAEPDEIVTTKLSSSSNEVDNLTDDLSGTSLHASSDTSTTPVISSVPPVKSKPVPLTIRNCKIDESVLKSLKDLKKLVDKGKIKAVMSQLDEWSMNGTLSDQQREFVDKALGV